MNPPPNPPPPGVTPVVTATDRMWQRKADQLEFVQLETMQATAEKWRNGLTMFTALITTVLAVGAPKFADAMKSADKTALGLLLGAALLSLVLGTYYAIRAASGQTSTIYNTGIALRNWVEERAKKSRNQLRRSGLFSALGFGLLVVAAVVGYTSPVGTASTPGQSARITVAGDSHCGTITSDENGTTLALTARDGTQRTFLLAEITSLHLMPSC